MIAAGPADSGRRRMEGHAKAWRGRRGGCNPAGTGVWRAGDGAGEWHPTGAGRGRRKGKILFFRLAISPGSSVAHHAFSLPSVQQSFLPNDDGGLQRGRDGADPGAVVDLQGGAGRSRGPMRCRSKHARTHRKPQLPTCMNCFHAGDSRHAMGAFRRCLPGTNSLLLVQHAPGCAEAQPYLVDSKSARNPPGEGQSVDFAGIE